MRQRVCVCANTALSCDLLCYSVLLCFTSYCLLRFSSLVSGVSGPGFKVSNKSNSFVSSAWEPRLSISVRVRHGSNPEGGVCKFNESCPGIPGHGMAQRGRVCAAELRSWTWNRSHSWAGNNCNRFDKYDACFIYLSALRQGLGPFNTEGNRVVIF